MAPFAADPRAPTSYGGNCECGSLTAMSSTSSQSASDLIALKAAAQDLGLSVEGLRRRLLRLRQGVRRGSRWYVRPVELKRMRFAGQVLGLKTSQSSKKCPARWPGKRINCNDIISSARHYTQ
jgi:hypothetical protein